MAPSLQQTIEIVGEKAYVILDRTILRIDQVAMSSGRNPRSFQDRLRPD